MTARFLKCEVRMFGATEPDPQHCGSWAYDRPFPAALASHPRSESQRREANVCQKRTFAVRLSRQSKCDKRVTSGGAQHRMPTGGDHHILAIATSESHRRRLTSRWQVGRP